MNTTSLICLSSAAVCVAAAGLVLHSAAPRATPSMVGTWSGSYSYASGNGVQKANLQLIIQKQEGNLISGLDAWDVHEGSKPNRQNSTPIYGVIAWDGHTADVAENGGFYRLSLTSANEMEATFLRTNQFASAFRVTLKKR